MRSEFLIIQRSIAAIDSYKQIVPTFKWIRLFEANFKGCSNAGVSEYTETLLNQLRNLEL